MKKRITTSMIFLMMTVGIMAQDVTINTAMATTIQNSLNAGTSYTLETTGNITVAANINKTSGTGTTLTLKATGKIAFDNNHSITSTSNALNIVFWSDSDASSDGVISLTWTTTITTNGGHLWIGGGSGTTTWNGLSVGDGNAKYNLGAAVLLNGATISTSGGDIQIKGESTANVQYSRGIWMNLGGLNAGSGNISLFGIGGLYTGTEANCDGIHVGGPITTTTGNISITGSSTAQPNTEGIAIEVSNIASTSGNISLIADIFFIQTSPRISSSGTLTLKPLTDGSTIGVGGGAGTLQLPSTYFSTNFTDGFNKIIIGSTGTGYINISGTTTYNDDLTFKSGKSIFFAELVNPSMTSSGSDLTLWSRAGGNTEGDDGIEGCVWMPFGSNVNTGGGDVVIGGGLDPTIGFCLGDNASTSNENNARYRGVSMNGTLNASGGNIDIRGRGKALLSARGVSIGGSVSTSGTGTINIHGIAKGLSDGIAFGDGSIGGTTGTLTSGTGTVTLSGTKDTGTNGINLAPYSGQTAYINCGGNLVIYSTGEINAANGYVAVAGTSSFAAEASAITLSNTNNDFTGNVSVSNGTNFTIVDKNAISLGAINISGLLNVQALSGNLTINDYIASNSTSTDAIKLYADYNKAAGDATGGNIIVTGTPAITTGTNGRAMLYTGSISGSTGLTGIVSSSNLRYNSDKNTGTFTPALVSGVYGIYRENTFTWVGGTAGNPNNWSTSTNWNAQVAPTSATNVTIGNATYQPEIGNSASDPAICNNLTIASGSSLTIPAGKALTVNGTLTNNAGISGLVIKSTANDATGSLINATPGVLATVERWMTGDIWHLISPAATDEESVDDFVGKTQNTNLIARKDKNYALAPYNETTDEWDYYKTDDSDINSITFTPGKGYQVLRASAVDGKTGTGNGTEGGDGKVDFKGKLGAADVSIGITKTPLHFGWNLIGNPYPCAMKVAEFITANSASIDLAYQAIYVAKISDTDTYGYQPHTYAPAVTNLAPGEGFFVKSRNADGTINFTPALKNHTSDAFKSAVKQYGFNLIAESAGNKMSTTVKYIPQMTAGLDPGWDLGLFYNGEDSPLSLYTRLVEDYGVDFTIQCLPDYDYENLVVPVGITAQKGATIEFSLANVTVPVGYKVFLEDRVNRKFTRLDEQGSVYSVKLKTASAGTGQFFLHTKQEVTGIKEAFTKPILVISVPQHHLIRVSGLVNLPAQATVYDINGRMITIKTLTSENENEIQLNGVSNGIYLLKIKSGTSTTQHKISWTL